MWTQVLGDINLSSLHLLNIIFSLGYLLSQWKASVPPGEGVEPVFSLFHVDPKRGRNQSEAE